MRNRSTRSILLAVRAEIDTVGIAVISAHAVVASFVASADCECVVHGETGACHSIEPVIVAAEVNAAVSQPRRTSR